MPYLLAPHVDDRDAAILKAKVLVRSTVRTIKLIKMLELADSVRREEFIAARDVGRQPSDAELKILYLVMDALRNQGRESGGGMGQHARGALVAPFRANRKPHQIVEVR